MAHHAVPFDPELQQPLFPKEAACPPEVRVMEEGLARLAMEHHATSEKPYIIYDAENPVPEPSFCGPGFVSFSVRKHEMLLVHSHLSWEAQAAGMLKALGTPLRRPQLERIHGKPMNVLACEAVRKKGDHVRLAREHFARASGSHILRGAGFDDEDWMETLAWDAFCRDAGTKLPDERRKIIDTLNPGIHTE